MQINFTSAMTLALASIPVVGNVDANHDGHISNGEIASACAQEIQVAASAFPQIATTLHTDPARLQAAAAKFAEGVAILAGGPIA